MRDFLEVAEEIRNRIRKLKGTDKQKQEFLFQLDVFMRRNKYYPPEARHPWDTLGHIVREYCSGPELLKWQKVALEVIRGGKKEKVL